MNGEWNKIKLRNHFCKPKLMIRVTIAAFVQILQWYSYFFPS